MITRSPHLPLGTCFFIYFSWMGLSIITPRQLSPDVASSCSLAFRQEKARRYHWLEYTPSPPTRSVNVLNQYTTINSDVHDGIKKSPYC